MQAIDHQIREYVIDHFLFGQGDGQLSNDDSLLEKGIIDSTGVLELVSFLEEKYQIRVEDEEVVPANLDSINNLVRFIEDKLQDSR